MSTIAPSTLARTNLLSTVTPSFLLESFLLGSLSIATYLGLYALWIFKRPVPHFHIVAVSVVVIYGMFVGHWALELRTFGSALGEFAIYVPEPPPEIVGGDVMSEHLTRFGIQLTTETTLLGSSLTLFVLALYTFNSMRSRSLGLYKSRRLVEYCVYILFAVALFHWVLQIYLFTFITAFYANPSLDRGRLPAILGLLTVCLLVLNVLVSDIIVLWRAYVAWNRSRIVLAMCTAFWLFTLGSMIYCSTVTYVNSLAPMINAASNSSDLIPLVGPLDLLRVYDASTLLWVISSLSLNVFATLLILCKAWWYHKEIGVHLKGTVRRTAAERIMALLVESGTVYNVIGLVYLLTAVRSYVWNIGMVNSLGALPDVSVENIFDVGLVQITSIYPTIIAILVRLGSVQEDQHQHQHQQGAMTTMRFSFQRNTSCSERTDFDAWVSQQCTAGQRTRTDVEHSAVGFSTTDADDVYRPASESVTEIVVDDYQLLQK